MKRVVYLSGHFAEIEPAECHLSFIDYDRKKKLKAHGLLATCIQHEVDHLNGVLFIDYLSKPKGHDYKEINKTKKKLIKLYYKINGIKNYIYGNA